MPRKTSIVIGLIASAVSGFLFGAHYGFDRKGVAEAAGKIKF